MTAINKSVDANYRWAILILTGLTATFVIAMPSMAMPVLFSEMSDDLGLSLVQIGAIWGTGSLAGLFTGLLSGSIGDRVGTKRILSIGCLGIGITGASRGLSNDFVTLAGTVFLAGLIVTTVPLNLHKVCGVWFSGRHLGLANGVVAAGMALGFMTGSMVSATFLSPWLGGWRNVLFFYGAVAVVMSIPWAFTRSAPGGAESALDSRDTAPMGQALSRVARIRGVWLMGLVSLGVGGGIQGMLGYLPLYLREVGWPAPRADGALASFHAMSLISVVPLALLSDRLGSRKRFLIIAAMVIASGMGMLSIAEGVMVWVAVLLAGAVRDGFMAIYMTLITELDGVGAALAGTALGLAGTISRLGGLFSPPLGNSLAEIDLRMPFLFWAAMAVVGLGALYFVEEGQASDAAVDSVPVAAGDLP
jgi:NNP family nitrate/nitrite transporter-like MFS transporter